MYNHNKAQQSKNRVHIYWDILYFDDSTINAPGSALAMGHFQKTVMKQAHREQNQSTGERATI